MSSEIITGAELLLRKLAEPFPETEIRWKPQAVKGNRAMAVAYIGARNVMDRLDEIIGPEGWKDSYELLAEGSVICKLSIWVGNQWVGKQDVGSPSEQPDGGDRLKAAFSDALKRAAVHWGIGRYLYRLPQTWVDFDPAKKQIVTPPKLPAWAVPAGSKSAAPAKQADRPANGQQQAKTGEVEKISADEFHELNRLFSERGVNGPAFLQTYKISRLADLPKAKYLEVVDLCKKKPVTAASRK